MLKFQLDRIIKNIFPFVLTGFFAGLAIGLSEFLREIDWLAAYFDYASIDFNLAETAKSVLDENLAPTTILFLLIIIFTLSALRRILFGAMESEPKERKGVIFILENFASLLGIAWLGLMWGLSMPAFMFEGLELFLGLLAMSLFPLILIFQLTIITSLIYWEGFHKIPRWAEEMSGWKMGTRLEGFIVLALAIFLVTYHTQYVELMNKLGDFLVSFL